MLAARHPRRVKESAAAVLRHAAQDNVVVTESYRYLSCKQAAEWSIVLNIPDNANAGIRLARMGQAFMAHHGVKFSERYPMREIVCVHAYPVVKRAIEVHADIVDGHDRAGKSVFRELLVIIPNTARPADDD